MRYIIIPHLQVPLQFVTLTSQRRQYRLLFFMTWVAALEEAELLCSVFSDNGKGVVILHQPQLPRISSGA
jgi:hypothetical protein